MISCGDICCGDISIFLRPVHSILKKRLCYPVHLRVHTQDEEPLQHPRKIHSLFYITMPQLLLNIKVNLDISSNFIAYSNISDIPMMMSGDFIGIIDPHKIYLPENSSAYHWHLHEDHAFIKDKQSQFAPLFHDLFNSTVDVLENNNFYNHTIFRFPLRNKESPLSDTCYTSEKVWQLFRSLMLDQGQSLLFLKSVQCIEFYKHSKDSTKPELVYKMKISGTTAEQIIHQRELFYEAIQQEQWISKPVETVLDMTIEVEHMESGKMSVERSKWLVYHTCYGDADVIHVGRELKVLPWVGIALQQSDPINGGNKPPSEPKGQLFATLPLPLDGTERTGLPFHIHAYFAMEQNRRHLRWPTKDQEGQRLQNPSLVWNQLLVNECIPRAVLAFFSKGRGVITPEVLYQLLPDGDLVDGKWQHLVSQVYRSLFGQPCLHTDLNGGEWIKPENSILSAVEFSPELNQLLKDILTRAQYPVVNPPSHIRKALEKYSPVQPLATLPAKVRDALLRLSEKGPLELEHASLMLVLKYLLENGESKDLLNLPLLPLLSGDMAVFTKCHASEPIYMTSENHPASLLPSLNHRIIAANLEPEVLAPLLNLAQKSKII